MHNVEERGISIQRELLGLFLSDLLQKFIFLGLIPASAACCELEAMWSRSQGI